MKPEGLIESIRQRLLNLSRENGEAFDFVLARYGVERFLYRLSESEHADHFVLKGSMLFHVWNAFLRKNGLDGRTGDFTEVISQIRMKLQWIWKP